MKKLIILVSLLAIAVTVYFIFSDSLPPRTPYKIAKKISSINVKNTFKIEEFHDNLKGGTGVVPSGDLYIRFELTDKQFRKVKQEVIELNYKKLPIKDFIYTPEFASKANKGYYKLEKSKSDPLDFQLTVLTANNNKLHVYLSE